MGRNKPRIMVRPDDLEEFIEIEPNIFSVKKSLEKFPNHLHHKYPYNLLIAKGFTLKGNKILKEKIVEILVDNPRPYSDTYLKVSKIDRGFELSLGAMYESPGITFAKLQGLAKLFKTDNIDVDNYSQGGCETCDFGSDYGHTIQILDPKKNIKEMEELLGKDLLNG
jgi:hypothetical protein